MATLAQINSWYEQVYDYLVTVMKSYNGYPLNQAMIAQSMAHLSAAWSLHYRVSGG